MTNRLDDLSAAIRERDEHKNAANKIAAEHTALSGLAASVRAVLADAEAKFSRIGDTAAERWLASGATDKPLEIDPKVRAELQRIREECAHKGAALDTAMKRKEGENAESSARYAEAQQRVTVAQTRVLGELEVPHAAEFRALVDRVEVKRRVLQGLHDEAFKRDAKVASEYASAIDAAWQARIESRWPEIETAAAEQLAAILAGIPS